MINVLITAIGGGGHGEQILKALKLAAPGRYWIVGADANPSCVQFSMVDQSAVLPLANSPEYMDRLFELIEKYKIRVLFHGCEPELMIFDKNRKAIQQRGVFLPINSTEVIKLCMDKEQTNRRLIELGFGSPKYMVIEKKSQLFEIDWFPVVVKPSVGGGGSANVYIAQDQKELVGLAEYLGIGQNKLKFIIQEYVGTPQQEYTVGILSDMNGEYINSIAIKRALTGQLNIRLSVMNRTGNSSLGPKLVISSGISQGQIGRFPEVTNQCKAIAKAIGARGSINIQCRLVDGVVKVFEINPRFSGTTSLRAMVGYNEPDVLIRNHILGEKFHTDFHFSEAVILRSLIETKLNMNI
jgi:carbamoyl-phosphate synthase large subunit